MQYREALQNVDSRIAHSSSASVDSVIAGNEESEKAHRFEIGDCINGVDDERPWRKATKGGWFSYLVNVQQRQESCLWVRRRGHAMPLAGLAVWTLIGVAGAFLPPILAVWSLFIGAGFIAYLGIMLSRFTGENFLDKNKPKNVFDSLFFHCVSSALLVYAIAIPFFRVDYTSLPLTVGILAGLMWVPHSWIIQHWVGIFHTVARTALVTAAWYLAPHHRFVVIPAVIVGVYGVTIVIQEQRWRALRSSIATAATA